MSVSSALGTLLGSSCSSLFLRICISYAAIAIAAFHLIPLCTLCSEVCKYSLPFPSISCTAVLPLLLCHFFMPPIFQSLAGYLINCTFKSVLHLMCHFDAILCCKHHTRFKRAHHQDLCQHEKAAHYCANLGSNLITPLLLMPSLNISLTDTNCP